MVTDSSLIIMNKLRQMACNAYWANHQHCGADITAECKDGCGSYNFCLLELETRRLIEEGKHGK